MEQVLLNKSRIPARITLLKPVSAAISIGTGGPFGAEGPIIATGGAVGSLVGQLLHTTAVERKTLLAAGAAAGMTATFGSPVSAVLLAVELLLFELRPRSLIPVALAAAAATAVRIAFVGVSPAFPMPSIGQPGEGALAAYVALGALVGGAAVPVTRRGGDGSSPRKHEGPPLCGGGPRLFRSAGVLLLAHVLRLQPLGTLHHVELHPIAFSERAEPVHLDGGVMDKDVLAALLRDEAEPLAIVEPLHHALRHEKPSLCYGRVHRPWVHRGRSACGEQDR